MRSGIVSQDTGVVDKSRSYGMENFQKVSHESRDITKFTPRFLHAKRLAKAKITKDIKDEMISPSRHIQRLGPLFSLTNLINDELAPTIDIIVDKRLAGAKGLVGKGIVHDASLTSVDVLVDGVPRRHGVDIAWVRLVVLGFLDIGFVVEDCSQAGWGVYKDAVGCDAEARA